MEILKEQGYAVEKARRNGRFGSVDFFGVFDIIAIRKDGGQLVQVKTNQTPCRDVVKGIRDFQCPSNIKKYLVIRYDRCTAFYRRNKTHWRIMEIGEVEEDEISEDDMSREE